MDLSRKNLQSIASQFEEFQIEEYINDIVEYVRAVIIAKAYYDSPNKSSNGSNTSHLESYVFKHSKRHTLKLDLPLQANGYLIGQASVISKRIFAQTFIPPYHSWNTHLPIILDRLRTLFPGVSFQVDPLKTYLYVDWS